jgi:hypothetical protein
VGGCNLIERLERQRHESNQMAFYLATFFAEASNILENPTASLNLQKYVLTRIPQSD